MREPIMCGSCENQQILMFHTTIVHIVPSVAGTIFLRFRANISAKIVP